MSELLSDQSLEESWVVANNSMNRERGIHGTNSYPHDLRFDLLGFLEERAASQERVVWVDLCCGSGRALLETAAYLQEHGLSEKIDIVGVDLVDYFAAGHEAYPQVSLEVGSLRAWSPSHSCDLITCVHGLHYVGDKLGLVSRAAGWLVEDGLFLGHLDRANLKTMKETGLARQVGKVFAAEQLLYHPGHRILRIEGHRRLTFPFTYVGARDDAGPNFTGQPAVNSYYEIV